MVVVDEEGGNESFAVTPTNLSDAAATFHKVAQDILSVPSTPSISGQVLDQSMDQLINNMYNSLSLSPDALQRVYNRWSDANTNLGNALEQMAQNLNTAAQSYTGTDQNVSSAFSTPSQPQ